MKQRWFRRILADVLERMPHSLRPLLKQTELLLSLWSFSLSEVEVYDSVHLS